MWTGENFVFVWERQKRERDLSPAKRFPTCHHGYPGGHLSSPESVRYIEWNNKSQTAGREGVWRRWRANNHQLEQPSLSQWILKASLSPDKRWVLSFSPLCCRHAMWSEQIGEKKPNSITPSCSQFYFIHSRSINVYSLGILRGPLSKCYHKEPWCLLHTQLGFILSSSSSIFLLVLLSPVSHLKLWVLLCTWVP